MNLVLSHSFQKFDILHTPFNYFKPLSVEKETYGLCPERNSWEEFIMLSTMLRKISQAIEIEEKKKKRLKRKRKRSDSTDSESSEDEIEEDREREVKRLKKIENKLKRKYNEFMYG